MLRFCALLLVAAALLAAGCEAAPGTSASVEGKASDEQEGRAEATGEERTSGPFAGYDPVAAAAAATDTSGLSEPLLDSALVRFDRLPRLHALVVARHGTVLAERYRRGYGARVPVNVKSASKSVLSAIAGAARAEGIFDRVGTSVAPLFERELATLDASVAGPLDPRLRQITWEDLLTMRAGLASTSGSNYSQWVHSRDWVLAALARPMVAVPGTRRIYSTGTSHLLGVALSRASGESLLALARRTLGEALGVRVPPWPTDPQGCYFGGNDMRLSPLALLRLGEAYRQGGVLPAADGSSGDDPRRLVPADWVRASWTPVARVGRGHGYRYGYGWFMKAVRSRGEVLPVYFAWGYGGQYLFVVPDLALTVVALSDPGVRTNAGGHGRAVHALLGEALIPAAQAGRQ